MTAAGSTGRGWTGRRPRPRRRGPRRRRPGCSGDEGDSRAAEGDAGLHGGVPVQVLDSGVAGVFAFRRAAPTGAILCLYNFTEGWLHLPEGWLRAEGAQAMHDALSDAPVALHHGNLALPPYARVWLT